ncbi:MAG: hypothetical protein Q7K43_06870 [Candidatus Woesearchaeota archaeon]|nr:hypothetical protein [Candidatus Woesearchaeota archaeon]
MELQYQKKPEFSKFSLLRISTPYADMTMEDLTGTFWKPETGLISVITHNDLSQLVVDLFLKTGEHIVLKQELQEILKNHMYTFKTKQEPQ